ncbi:MAG: hypothetical protein JWP69_1639 [Flaviaesturariibacter sp.]|nr:hypothetical protein [Flaviaesturariibacter sp.]
MIDTIKLMSSFLSAAKEDPRISPVHISLYAALLLLWQQMGGYPFCVFSHQVMPFCKISGTATYHKAIRELHTYGYIRYHPSYNHFQGSAVYFTGDKNDHGYPS